MSSYTQLIYHLVFSTKYRGKRLIDPRKERIYQYMGGVIRESKGNLLEIGGVEDHVHLLLTIHSTIAVSDSIRVLKSNTSKWINDNKLYREPFEWQKGFGAFTVSYMKIDAIRRYIQNQESHHRKETFEDEYMRILTKHGIPFKRKYLFEEEYLG